MRPRRALALGLRELAGLVRDAFLASLGAIVIPSLIFVLAHADASYAGASDAKTADVATTRYAAYLEQVGVLTAAVAASACLIVAVVTLGLVLAVHARYRARMRRATTKHVVLALAATLATAVYAGYGAQRHPGLFLEALSGSATLQLMVEACAYLGPLLAVVAVAGYVSAAVLGDAAVRVAAVCTAMITGAAGIGLTRRARAFVPAPFASAPEAADTTEGDDDDNEPEAPRAGRFPTVLWIAVDSLRPDMIDAAHTPNLAKLLSESVYFDNAIVPVPRTGPSWAAAMTSLSPLSNGIETMFPSKDKGALSTVSLPAHLASQGFRTMVTSEYAGEFFGRVDFGFQQKSVPRAELMQISGQILMARAPLALSHLGLVYSWGPFARAQIPPVLTELVRALPNFSHPAVLEDDVLAFLRGAPAAKPAEAAKRPAFVLAFYSQPHFPYTSSARFGARYRVPGSSASLAYGRDVTNETPITTEADKKQIVALYRAALAETDEAVGHLMESLKMRGVLDDAVVVLSADHGEGLYECDTCVGHGDNLRGTMTLRVPLAFRLPRSRFPKAAPQVIHDYVSTLDVYPTILSLLGLRRVAIHEGRPLLERTGAPKRIAPRTFFIETGEWLWETAAVPNDRITYPPITEIAHLEGDRIAIDPKFDAVIRAAKHRAVLRPPYKLMYEPTPKGVRYRLFDIDADPLDEHDLSKDKPKLTAELREALRREVLGHAFLLPAGDFFVTRPQMPDEDHW